MRIDGDVTGARARESMGSRRASRPKFRGRGLSAALIKDSGLHAAAHGELDLSMPVNVAQVSTYLPGNVVVNAVARVRRLDRV